MQKDNLYPDIAAGKKESYTEDEMARGVPILSDIVFKYIFGTEGSTEILKTFINAVLKDAGFPEITSVTVVNPFNDKTYVDEKYSIIDTRAEDAKGNKYNVEVQVRTQADYQERSLYYWAKSYSEQLQDGEFYGALKRVTSISIVNYRLFPEHIPCHSCYMLRENNSPDDVLTEDCIMHYLEVPKLSGKPKKEIEKWLYFIGHGDKEDETVRVLLSKDRMMEEAKRRYEYFVADERARIAYQQREKFLRDQANYIHTAKMEGLAAGRAEGLEQGKTEGLKMGKAEGKAEGLEEGAHRKALETAGKLKSMGLSVQQIADATGLNEVEIKQLSDA